MFTSLPHVTCNCKQYCSGFALILRWRYSAEVFILVHNACYQLKCPTCCVLVSVEVLIMICFDVHDDISWIVQLEALSILTEVLITLLHCLYQLKCSYQSTDNISCSVHPDVLTISVDVYSPMHWRYQLKCSHWYADNISSSIHPKALTISVFILIRWSVYILWQYQLKCSAWNNNMHTY